MGYGRALLEPPPKLPRDRRGNFVNYSRTVATSPAAWHAPATEDEVVALVRAASGAEQRVKVVGAGHSWSAIAAPDDLAFTLERMRGVVGHGPGWVRVRAGSSLSDLSHELAGHGQTLPIIGSITEPSVGGAVSTATHGSSLEHGNLSSLVLGARLVAGDGSVLDVAGGDERLPGVQAGLGALGVLTEVTLRTTPAFNLAETVEQIPIHRLAGRVEEIGRSAEFVKIWWMPHTPKALAFRYERTAEPMTRRPSPETQRVIENWLPLAVLPALFAWHERHAGAVPAFNRVATRWLIKKRRVGPSRLMITTPFPYRHHETEAAVPLATGAEALDRTVRMIERLDLRVNFILELRYVQGDAAWMSPAQGADTVHLGACTAITGERHAYFDGFWQEMRQIGGRPHWAKEMRHAADEIRALYPMADRFLALRDQLDPQRVFSNRFLDRVLGA